MEQLTLVEISALALVGQLYLDSLDADPENELLSFAQAFVATDIRNAVEKSKRILEASERPETVPPATTSFTERSGVAWWGKTPQPGVCQCCQLARAVYPAFNGGAHLAIRACSKCMKPDHLPEACEDRR